MIELRSDPIWNPQRALKIRKDKTMDQWVQIISNVGFPIFVSLFLLAKIEPTLKKTAEVMAKILQHMEEHC